MQKHPNTSTFVSTLNNIPLGRVVTGSDLRSQPPSSAVSNGEAPSGPEKLSSCRNGTIDECKNGPSKNKFALREAAYKRSIRGKVLIPACILKKNTFICRLVRRKCSDQEIADAINDVELQAFKEPLAPVNKETMKELELGAIQNNTSLRIDLCFDDHLVFQPIKGRKGEEKQRQARVFWESLSLELEADRHALQGDCIECAKEQSLGVVSDTHIPSRLAVFFTALRDLVEMLVPDKDKKEILKGLDVDDLVRKSRVGSLDAPEFSTWLAQLLMTHCAPLRDGMARQMNQQISDGARMNNMDLLVEGLETLLSLLEHMKLDVANHQVRSFKLLLIADTVPFLQDCFSKMCEDQQIDLKSSRKWFMDLQKREHCQKKSDFDNFLSGSVALCRFPLKWLPTTFSYDKDRLACLRHEVLDLTQLRICMNHFEQLALAQKGRRPTVVEAANITDRFLRFISSDDATNESEAVDCHVEEIAAEIVRAVSVMSTGVQPQTPEQVTCQVDVQQAIDELEDRLKREQFSVMSEVIEELTERTAYHASQFQKLDTLQMSNAQRVWSTNRALKNFLPAPDMEDIARRLAHIIIIHWSVWVNLAYLEDQPNIVPT